MVKPIKNKKIKKLAEELEKEISERKTAIEYIVRGQEEQKRYLMKGLPEATHSYIKFSDEINKLEKIKEEMSKKVEKLEGIKQEILGYTIEIIAIITSILAIILTFTFLSTEMYKAPDRFIWILTGAIGYFLVIFTLWVNTWRKRNKNSQNNHGGNMAIPNQNATNGSNTNVSDWIQYLKHISNINTSLLSSLSASYFASMAIIMSAVIYVTSPGTVSSVEISMRKFLLIIILASAVFIITYNNWYRHYHESPKRKQLADNLLTDIVVNRRYKTIVQIEEKWKTEEKKITDAGKFEKYTYSK
jgi:hypothetical protein